MKTKLPSLGERLLRALVRKAAQFAMLVREEIDRADLDSKGHYRCTCSYVHIKGTQPCVTTRSGSPRNIS
jgi:hypothetical protein